MNKIMYACGLESKPRWIDMGAIDKHRYNYMCSACGGKSYKQMPPKKCPNCNAEMKST